MLKIYRIPADISVDHILSTLKGRERKILEMTFGLRNRIPSSIDAVARELRISPERVRQIKRDAILKIRKKNSSYIKRLYPDR
ncbi:hypothetical protein IM792_02385 [Mucilaginibacter sp. JRF]|nr:hypothetical protein [Mucilaginibacter sp. JRF]